MSLVFAAQDELKGDCYQVHCKVTSFTSWSGHLYVSDRLVFDDGVKRLILPYNRFREGRVQQPWFGANYYDARILPIKGGGLDQIDDLTVQFTFIEGGIERFIKSMEVATTEESLPVYQP